MNSKLGTLVVHLVLLILVLSTAVRAELPEGMDVEGQPLAANILRVVETLQLLGHPLEPERQQKIQAAARKRDAEQLQKLLQPLVLATVEINPEVRVKVQRGMGKAEIQQHGFRPLLIKVHNHSTVEAALQIDSPQGGAVYAGSSLGTLKRQEQTELNRDQNRSGSKSRFLEVEVYRDPPMTQRLSGLKVEYVVVLISSTESGIREAQLQFDVGSGTQDLGFRGELPILFHVLPAVPVRFNVRDETGKPSIGRFIITDDTGRVYPSQIKRLAPDLFFQPQIYRADGETVLLPPGKYMVARQIEGMNRCFFVTRGGT